MYDVKVPEIKIEDKKLVISITLDELIFAIENKGDEYKIDKPHKFLEKVKFNLENYAGSNATEKGISELQNLFDTIADEIFINEENIISQKQI